MFTLAFSENLLIVRKYVSLFMPQLHLLWFTVILIIGSGIAVDVPFVFDENSSDLSGYNSDQLEAASASSHDLVGVPPVSLPDDGDIIEVTLALNKSINQSFKNNSTIEPQNILLGLIAFNPESNANVTNFSTDLPPELLWSNTQLAGRVADSTSREDNPRPASPTGTKCPEHPDAKNYLKTGNWYYNEPNNDYANALKCYEEGIKLRPSDASLNADLWYGKGNALLKLGKYNDSLAAYDMAISFKPNYRNAWDAKCRILNALHRDSSYACSRANASG